MSEQILIERQDSIRKLNSAEKNKDRVYIFGETGYGKTVLLQQYFCERKYQVLSCRSCSTEELMEALEKSVPLVLDSLHLLPEDSALQNAVQKLVTEYKGFLILVSRCSAPAWLMPAFYSMHFLTLNESALIPKNESVLRYFEKNGIHAEPDTVQEICNRSLGNSLIIAMLCSAMQQNNGALTEAVFREAEAQFDKYVTAVTLDIIPEAVLQILMILSIPSDFTNESAFYITENEYVSRLVEKASSLGNFIIKNESSYVIRMPMRQILYRLALERLGNLAVQEYSERAAGWYERNGDLEKAAMIWHKIKNQQALRALLIKNAYLNPAVGFYYELREYYKALTPEDTEDSPVLMRALCMLNSILLDIDTSEMWYNRLKAYAEKAEGQNKKDAKVSLVYLSISLPHRKSLDILTVFRNLPQVLLRSSALPEFSITTNTPSLMNGGKDFCSWSKHDDEIAATVGKIVQMALGRNGYGIVSTALCESYYEKGRDSEKIYSLLNQGMMEAEAGGNYELVLVTTTIAIRMKLIEGKIEAAESLLRSLRTKVQTGTQSVNMKIQLCLDAIACRIALFRGNHDIPDNWMKTAPDENAAFHIMDRFFYSTKLRIYVARGQYQEALDLISKMMFFADICERVYIKLELLIFKSIILYRTASDWQSVFADAIELGAEYRYVRIFSEKGDALIPLLREYINHHELPRMQQKWFTQILEETQMVALYYPLLLKQTSPDVVLKEKPLAILKLQANGYSIPEIAKNLDMNPETVRYYVKQTYQKLGVSSKTAAILTARTLNLI